MRGEGREGSPPPLAPGLSPRAGGVLIMQADIKLDTLGYFCPMPIILTSKKIKELSLGQVLEVVSDDEGIKKDMPAWCETTGHQMLGLEEEQAKSGRIYKVFVKKTK